jgi:hypothetical protein
MVGVKGLEPSTRELPVAGREGLMELLGEGSPPVDVVFVYNFMVGVKGLEPSTSRSQTARASQLRHTPMCSWLL